MFYLERVTKKGEGEIDVELLENGQGFSTADEAWLVKNQIKYEGQANVVVIWYEDPPKPKKKF
ncbi:MAG: hypothetical protein Q8N84_00930 [bacterium]|nr:hypothetical protein [bacterium]